MLAVFVFASEFIYHISSVAINFVVYSSFLACSSVAVKGRFFTVPAGLAALLTGFKTLLDSS